MHDLTYGGYFVKEQQAPEGFYLDENTYYFEITEHGKTITVENETGKGFVNTSQVGSLKIVKTSSDGKVEGFSFRVTGSNGYSRSLLPMKTGKSSSKISALAITPYPKFRTGLLPPMYSLRIRQPAYLRVLLPQ